MEEKITVLEALKYTIEMLGNISVPVSMNEQVAVPVAKAIHNINACILAMTKEDEAEESEDE